MNIIETHFEKVCYRVDGRVFERGGQGIKSHRQKLRWIGRTAKEIGHCWASAVIGQGCIRLF
jgi:hypothetical protein